MHVRSRRSAGPHAIRNRVVALQLAFLQNNHMCNQRYPPDFLQTGISTWVPERYAQVPQHFAISLIFRTTVDKKKIRQRSFRSDLASIAYSCLVLVRVDSVYRLALLTLAICSLEVYVHSLVLGCRSWLQDRIGNVIYERLTRFFKL